jgi:hypothetical protein
MTAHDEHKDAIDLLMEDHRLVEGLFARFESAGEAGGKETLARRICQELVIHTMLEEEIFYPALRGKVDQDLLEEAFVEHDSAKLLIREIEDSYADEAYYGAKVHVLKEAIEHHVEEEEDEHKGLFVQARHAGVDLRAIGEAMRGRKVQLLQDAEAGDLPPAEPRTFVHEPAAQSEAAATETERQAAIHGQPPLPLI